MKVYHDAVFPSIISNLTIPAFSGVKESLIRWIYEYMNGKDGRIVSNVGGWQSDDDFWLEESFKEYLDYMMLGIDEFSRDFGSYKYTISNMWINVNRKGDFNSLHCHPEAHMSGCFYINVPENSGGIQFRCPNLFVNSHLHRNINSEIEKLFNFSPQWNIPKPLEGGMIFFPSYLYHTVVNNNSNEDRISIAFNLN